jgi:hypothetical protein
MPTGTEPAPARLTPGRLAEIEGRIAMFGQVWGPSPLTVDLELLLAELRAVRAELAEVARERDQWKGEAESPRYDPT